MRPEHAPGPPLHETEPTAQHTTRGRLRLLHGGDPTSRLSPMRRRNASIQMRAADGPPPARAAFWLVGVLFFLLLFVSGAPSPLYGVYQAEWRFPASTLTAIFAVYALVLLVTLLFLGRVSDYLGRRRVIAGGLGVNAAACALFLVAHGVAALFVARALQGMAVGLATGALGAALVELQPEESGLGPLVTSSAPALGLAAGALVTSVLVQYAPAPTHLIWWLLLAASVVGTVAVFAAPESAATRPGLLASLRPRIGVPTESRRAFWAALPCFVAVWALGGLYLSLGPSLTSELVRSHNILWGGVVIFLLSGTGAIAAVLSRGTEPARAMRVGCAALLVGVGVTCGAIAASSGPAFLAGTTLAGVGFGVAYLGAFRTSTAPAAASDRAGLIAAIYIVNYLAFSIPALIAGEATSRFGLRDTSLVYGAAIALLVAVALAVLVLRLPVARDWSVSVLRREELPAGPCSAPATTLVGAAEARLPATGIRQFRAGGREL